MSDLVHYSMQGDVAVLTVDNPPVNALSPGVPEGIGEGLSQALADDAVKAVVLIGGGRTFIAGADIKEFLKFTSGQERPTDVLHRVIMALEDSPKPVVCAMHGTALGGGLEVAMACHYRIAAADAQVGQPEVKIGLIPGAGGTQRLPRLCGIALAAELCATGRMVSAKEALSAGIVDRLAEVDLLEAALAFAREQAAAGTPPRKTREITDRLGNEGEWKTANAKLRQVVAQKGRGQIAPAKAIDAVELAATIPFADAMKEEARLFFECLSSPQSQGLIHIFFGERMVGKVPGIGKETPRRKISSAGVVGAGTMGGGIAMTYADAGIPVVIREVDQQQLDMGLAKIRGNYEGSVKRGRLTPEQAQHRMDLITPTTDMADLKDADVIVEAVFENMALKKQVFAEIDRVAKPDALLATNTSTLDVDEIASATSRPASVIGHHFFSPANVMKLLEVVRGSATSEEAIATSMDLARRLGKVGVLAGNCFGFIGNRMFFPYLREAQFLVEEGANVSQVDRALYEFGMAMGPLAVIDLAGIDVDWRVQQENKDHIPAGRRTPLGTDLLYERGRYGQKTGAGWYRYEDGRTPMPDTEVDEWIAAAANAAGIARREIDDAEIVDRTVYALVNEGARLLEEGIALRAVDIDVVYVFGYGFPAWRGGPMRYADQVGLKKVYDRVCEFHEQQGDWWKPAPLLKQLAEAGGKFTS